MVHAALSRPTASHPARIRALLVRAREQAGDERFWSLAVATQLLDEHRAALERRASLTPCPIRRHRIGCVLRAWEAHQSTVAAELRQLR